MKARKLLVLIHILGFLFVFLGNTTAQEETKGCQEIQKSISSLSEQVEKISNDMRIIKRELALLRQRIEKPGMKEILAGIGYIFGILGVAFYVRAKKSLRKQKCI